MRDITVPQKNSLKDMFKDAEDDCTKDKVYKPPEDMGDDLADKWREMKDSDDLSIN